MVRFLGALTCYAVELIVDGFELPAPVSSVEEWPMVEAVI